MPMWLRGTAQQPGGMSHASNESRLDINARAITLWSTVVRLEIVVLCWYRCSSHCYMCSSPLPPSSSSALYLLLPSLRFPFCPTHSLFPYHLHSPLHLFSTLPLYLFLSLLTISSSLPLYGVILSLARGFLWRICTLWAPSSSVQCVFSILIVHTSHVSCPSTNWGVAVVTYVAWLGDQQELVS